MDYKIRLWTDLEGFMRMIEGKPDFRAINKEKGDAIYRFYVPADLVKTVDTLWGNSDGSVYYDVTNKAIQWINTPTEETQLGIMDQY